MTTKDAAKRWGYSKKYIQKICSSGIIFFASKNEITKKWEIPEMDKPPVTRSRAVKYIKSLTLIRQEAELVFPNDAEEVFSYLAKQGFITSLDSNGKTLLNKLQNIKITDAGLELVQKEYISNPKKYEIGAEVEITIPFIKLKLNGNYKNL